MESSENQTSRIGRQGFRRGGLTRTLLFTFLPLVVGLVLLTGVAGIVISSSVAQARAFDQLDLVGTLKEQEIDRWLRERERDLAVLTGEPTLRQHVASLVDPEADEQERLAAYSNLGIHLSDFLDKKVSFAELFFLEATSGQSLVSTDVLQEGKSHRDAAYFQEGLAGSVILPPEFEPRLNVPTLFLARPVLAQDGAPMGVLVGRINLGDLSVLMQELAGLGETGETYLVDERLQAVTRPRFGEEGQQIDTEGVRLALAQQGPGSAQYTNYRGTQVLGVYRWLPDLQVVLLGETSRDEVLASRRIVIASVTVTVLAAALIAAGVILYVSRRITRPITELTEAATEMAAGDLSRRVAVEREDEIGALSLAFDDMADQVQDLIGTLEERVASRTRDLEQRAVQLATAADVGRAAASILELETLARQVVELVRDRFDLYYAGLFLLDDAAEYAILEAGSGEPGRLMKEQGHRLMVGGVSMVGSACAQKKARIALDVGAEAVRFDNPLLPETRSEMALPLLVGDRVLGALDVQSAAPAAFSEEDIAVLQLVADQVAVAVDNALKFSEEAALVEATNPLFRISRRLTAATTTDEVAQGIIESVAETEADRCAVAQFDLSPEGEVTSITFLAGWDRRGPFRFPIGTPLSVDTSLLPLSMMIQSLTIEDVGRDPRLTEDARQTMVQIDVLALANVPLRRGEQPIGFVNVGRATAGPWSAVAMRLYETLSDQAAVALERARLLEETQVRARRDRLIDEIGSRVQGSLDPDTILKTTVQELGRALGARLAMIEITEPPGNGQAAATTEDAADEND